MFSFSQAVVVTALHMKSKEKRVSDVFLESPTVGKQTYCKLDKTSSVEKILFRIPECEGGAPHRVMSFMKLTTLVEELREIRNQASWARAKELLF